MAKSKNIADASTEEKIIEAARKVFTKKGYAATRTRDIAEEADINLALLNYYFRSKEKLFQLVMLEKIKQLFSVVIPIVNNEDLSLEDKLQMLIDNYIDLLKLHPDLPIFILSEIRANTAGFQEEVQVQKILGQSSLVKQLEESYPAIAPVQFIVSLLGMVIFPFVAKPILFSKHPDFNALMDERKILVNQWAKAMLKS